MKTQQRKQQSTKQAMESKIFGLNKIILFVSIAWAFLLYPVEVHHASTMLQFGFLPINIENHLIIICILMGISLLGRKWLGRIKIEMPHSIAFACGGGMLWIIVFFISVNELAIPFFLASTLAVAPVIKRQQVQNSYLQISIVTACVYAYQVGMYFTIFSLFFKGAESLIMSALLLATHVACIFTVILTLVQSVGLLKRNKLNISEIILTDALVLCLTASIILLGIYSKSSILPCSEAATIIAVWFFLRMYNYLQQKPKKADD